MQQITGEHPYKGAISIKLQRNFIEITLRHGCSPVNLLHIFRTSFPKNTFYFCKSLGAESCSGSLTKLSCKTWTPWDWCIFSNFWLIFKKWVQISSKSGTVTYLNIICVRSRHWWCNIYRWGRGCFLSLSKKDLPYLNLLLSLF